MEKLLKKSNVRKRLCSIYKGYAGTFFLISITIVSNIIICFCQPLVRTFLFDKGIICGNWKVILFSSGIMIFFFFFDGINNYLQLYCSFKIRNVTNYRMVSAGLKKIMRLNTNKINEKGALTFVENLRADANTISGIADKNIIVLISNLFGIIGGVIGLFALNWKLTLLSLFIMSFKIIHTSYFAHLQKKMFRKHIQIRAQMTSFANNISLNIRNIKLWNLYPKIHKKLRFISRSEINILFKLQLTNESQITINNGIDLLLNISIYIVGTLFYLDGKITVGELMAFLSSIGLISVPIALVSYLKNEFAKRAPSLERLDSLMALEDEYTCETKKEKLSFVPSVISFSDVSFSNNKKKILSGISFSINKGERIAIWGRNGAGKSTLINLLLRLSTPTSGKICFDNFSVEEFDIDSYRNIFSYVSQDQIFFDETVEENLFLSHKEDLEKMIDFIPNSLMFDKDFFQKQMVANGSNFSGGERQKIALLRATTKRGHILILDEATANYDQQSVVEYDQYISDISSAYDYVFLITHNIGELQLVDKVIVLDQGRLQEIVTPAEFMSKYEKHNEREDLFL